MSGARRVDVALDERAYPILIETGLLARADAWREHVRGRHALVVTNPVVGAHYAQALLDGLGAHATALVEIPDGEEHKTLAHAERVFGALAALKASRDATVLALGGGVVGDLAGFAAALWMRGVRCVQVPTSLLAMVDSSVGGKTAVNLPEGKNLVGAFHQPSAVLIDPATLDTLPDRELACGLAEVVKYGAIGDPAFVDWLGAHADALLARERGALVEAIATSCAHKAGIVARDERETGERALLNFGHTFGHALETEAGYGTIKHGEAVAIGMVLAARLSERLGLADGANTRALRDLLVRLRLPVALPPGLDPQRLLGHMRLDKKAASGALRLILWRGVGRAEIVADVPDDAILAVLA